MFEPKNMISQVFETLYALRLLTLAFFIVNCAVSIVETWYPDTWVILALNALFGSIFSFYFYCWLLGIGRDKQNLKLFGKFVLCFVLVSYVSVMALIEFVAVIFNVVSGENPDTIFLDAVNILCIIVVGLLPLYFLGTVLPAHILGVGKRLSEAVSRVLRKTSYLLPRFLGVFVATFLLSILLSLVLVLGGPDYSPITPTGELNSFSLLLLLLSNLFGIFSDAVFMVIMTNIYMMDLHDRGLIPSLQAEVFS